MNEQKDLVGRKVFVLDGELRSCLAVTRSLGRRGAEVVVGSPGRDCLAGMSRYASVVVMYADPELESGHFVDDIERICKESAITDLLPLSEVALGTILKCQHRFSHLYFPYVGVETYNLAVDKNKLSEIAAKLGISTPKSILCTGTVLNEEALGQISYPAVLKSVQSRIYVDDKWLRTKVQYAKDVTELRGHFFDDPQFKHPFMLQEFIAGEGKGVFFLYDKGREVARFSHRRIREKPPSGGVSVLSESVRADESLFEVASKLLDELSWHGVAMVEFKMSEAGNPYLMEINPRFWGSLQLAIDAGVDFPYLLLAMNNQKLEQTKIFKEGVRLRWILGDLDRLIIMLKSKKYGAKDKLEAFLSFFNFFSLRTQYETFRLGDIRPFIYELKIYLADIFSSLPKK